MNSQEKLDDYYLEFEFKENADTMLLDSGFVTGVTMPVLNNSNLLPLNEQLFKIDTVVFQNLKSSFVTLKNKKSGYSLKFTFNEFPVLAIWKKPGANFLCIEPWQGYGDPKGFRGELKDKPGIVRLNVNEEFKKSYSIEME
jgi:galactose mutarotase-like enzyme